MSMTKISYAILYKQLMRQILHLIMFAVVPPSTPSVSFVILIQSSGIPASFVGNFISAPSDLSYSQRFIVGVRFALLAFVMDLFILWAPVGTLVASYVLGGGWQGVFVKALVTTVAMSLYRYAMNRWVYLRFQDSVSASKALQNQSTRTLITSDDPPSMTPDNEQNRVKHALHKTKSIDSVIAADTQKALEHLTMDEEKGVIDYLEAKLLTTKKRDGGKVTPLQTVALSTMKQSEDDGEEETKTLEQTEKRQQPTTNPKDVDIADLGTQVKLMMSFIYAGFYVVTGTVLLRQSIQDTAFFYLTATLTVTADMLQYVRFTYFIVGQAKSQALGRIANLEPDDNTKRRTEEVR
ncbi:hypothetical protein HDV05_002173 [Chytridiales sp. JEL 0842]|nr:hypothetical protein HDV05_002173 [Chytridiales sp. JEL 0842]